MTENIVQTSTNQTISDGLDWPDNSTGIPASEIMTTGEGAMLFNPGTSPLEMAFSVHHT